MPKTGGSALPIVKIYADGACSGNPGPGGWGAILRAPVAGTEKQLSGSEKNTTNNRMELMAVIGALEALKVPCLVEVVTDSRYVANAFRLDWIGKWQRNGWKTASGQPVKNIELWRRLLAAAEPHTIVWTWIRGHAGHPENGRADRLAVAARLRIVENS